MKKIGKTLGIHVVIAVTCMLLLLIGNHFLGEHGLMAVTVVIMFGMTIFPSFTDKLEEFEPAEVLVIITVALLATVFICLMWLHGTMQIGTIPVYTLVLLYLLGTRAWCHENLKTISYIGTFSAVVIGLGLGQSSMWMTIIGVITYIVNGTTLVLGPKLIKKFPKD